MMGLSGWSLMPGTGGGSGIRSAMSGGFVPGAFAVNFRQRHLHPGCHEEEEQAGSTSYQSFHQEIMLGGSVSSWGVTTVSMVIMAMTVIIMAVTMIVVAMSVVIMSVIAAGAVYVIVF